MRQKQFNTIICFGLIAALLAGAACNQKKSVSGPDDDDLEEPAIVFYDTTSNVMSAQQDIPWPSLAESPWPAPFKNAQCVTRSSLIGPDLDHTGLQFTVPGGGDWEYKFVIGPNGEIYTIKGSTGLFAFSANGDSLWNISQNDFTFIPNHFSSPIVDNLGVVYGAAGRGYPDDIEGVLFAVNSDGSLKWAIENSDYIISPLALGLDGTLLYITADGAVCAVNTSDGSEKWHTAGVSAEIDWCAAIPFSPDGNSVYFSNGNGTIVSLNTANGNQNWAYPANMPYNRSIMVDNAGRIYGFEKVDGNDYFLCLDASGTRIWNAQLDSNSGAAEGALKYSCIIDWNGWVYATQIHELYCFDYNGNMRWRRDVYVENDLSTILCDADNQLYKMYYGNWSNDYVPGIIKFNSAGDIDCIMALTGRQSAMMGPLRADKSLLTATNGADGSSSTILEIE